MATDEPRDRDPRYEETFRDPRRKVGFHLFLFLVSAGFGVAVAWIWYTQFYLVLAGLAGGSIVTSPLFLAPTVVVAIPVLLQLAWFGARFVRSLTYSDSIRVIDDALYLEYRPIPFAIRYGDERTGTKTWTEIPIERIEDCRVLPPAEARSPADDPGRGWRRGIVEALPDLLVPGGQTANGRASSVRDAAEETGYPADSDFSVVELDLGDDRVRLVTERPGELIDAIQSASGRRFPDEASDDAPGRDRSIETELER